MPSNNIWILRDFIHMQPSQLKRLNYSDPGQSTWSLCCVCSRKPSSCQEMTSTFVSMRNFCVDALPHHHSTAHLTASTSTDTRYSTSLFTLAMVSPLLEPLSHQPSIFLGARPSLSCFSRPETDASVSPLAPRKICSPCIALHQPNVVSFRLSI